MNTQWSKLPDLQKIEVDFSQRFGNGATRFYMFPQLWGSSTLGFGGVGMDCMTPSYTVIVYSTLESGTYAVYFDESFAYAIASPNQLFFNHMKSYSMLPVSKKYMYAQEVPSSRKVLFT